MRLVMFGAMAALLLVSLCVPEAFGSLALAFALIYGVVRIAHIALFMLASPDDDALRHSVLGLAVSTAIAVVAAGARLALRRPRPGGALGARPRSSTWAAPTSSAPKAGNWSPAHFAERHGLIVIIALGESIVAIGVGASHTLNLGIGTAAVLGVALTAAMWWIYFDIVAIVAGRRLADAEPGRVQNEMARDSYSYMHLAMVAGIVLVALGLKTTIGHFDDHLHAVPAFALLGGLAIYLLGHVAFRYRHVHTVNRRRLLLGDRPADPRPGRDRGPGAGRARRRQRADLGADRLRDPQLRRGPPARSAAPRPAEADRRRRGPSGCSNSCITPATAKQRAPVSVPQLAIADRERVAVEGRTKEATAETMKRTEPSWLTATIHQPRSRRRQKRQPRPISTIARWPEIEEERAADHVRRPDQPVLCGRAESVDERVDQVDREDERADEEDDGAEPVQPPRLARPPAPARRRRLAPAARLVDDLQHRGVAAGAEEDAADQVDRAAGRRPADAGLRQRRAEREQRAADHEGGRRDRVDAAGGYGATKVAGSGPMRSPRSRPSNRGHLVVAQLEVEDVDVLADPLRRDRLGDDDVAELQVPAQDRLGRRLAVARGDRRRSSRRRAARPGRAGSRPRSRCRARRARRAARPAGSAGAARSG